jgi:capsular exopolysaccharide synthesis family protein
MLQTSNRADGSINQDTAPPELRLPVVSVADVIAFVRRHLRLVLLMCLTAWGIALLYLIVAAPTFTAAADIVIETKTPLGDAASVSTIVESQIGILRSESVASAVIRKLDLLQDPEFVGRSGGVRSMLGSMLGWNKPEAESIVMQRAVESFQRKLSAKRVGITYIVGLTFDYIEPQRAAQILNTVTETYIAQQMDAKYNSTLRDEAWIKGRLSELSTQASTAQKALEDYYKSKNNAADSANAVDQLLAAQESSASAYDNFRHVLRHTEATRQQSAPVFQASLINEASPPLRASSPKSRIVFGISTVAGVFLGIAIGLLRDMSDKGIRAGGQFCNDLQLACIAVVPMVGSDSLWRMVGSDSTWREMTTFFSGLVQKLPGNLAQKLPGKLASLKVPATSTRNGPMSNPAPLADDERISRRALSTVTSTGRPGSRNIVRTESPIWTIIDTPESPFTEAFLEIKLAIDTMSRNGKRNQVIGITSTQRNEGKSTVAAALALLIAQTGARAILLDCNFRNRSLSAALAPGAACGIFDVMTGATSVPATTWSDPSSRLAFLPAGNSSRPVYASDVLASPRLAKLFQSLRDAYEYVIVDLPAVTPFTDVRAAAHLVDSFILVVESGRTNINVERALKGCSDIDEIMLGVALNKA